MSLTDLVTHRMSQLLVVVHSIYVVVLYATVEGQNGFSYHPAEEPFILQLLTTIDYPSIFLVGIASLPIFPTSPGPVFTFIYFCVLFAVASIQWLLVGWTISQLWKAISLRRSI
jgi:hypothetical protein